MSSLPLWRGSQCWFSLSSTSSPPSLPLENCSSTHCRILISLLMLPLKSRPKWSCCTDQRQLCGAILPPLKREPFPLKKQAFPSVWLFSKTKQNKNKQNNPFCQLRAYVPLRHERPAEGCLFRRKPDQPTRRLFPRRSLSCYPSSAFPGSVWLILSTSDYSTTCSWLLAKAPGTGTLHSPLFIFELSNLLLSTCLPCHLPAAAREQPSWCTDTCQWQGIVGCSSPLWQSHFRLKGIS